MSFVELVILIFIGWVALFSIVSRVCTCLEKRAICKYSGRVQGEFLTTFVKDLKGHTDEN